MSRMGALAIDVAECEAGQLNSSDSLALILTLRSMGLVDENGEIVPLDLEVNRS
ncbi:hypothetical protein [Streptomyces sp. NPDC056796]|uniref:hypothetical protein n=1 Tax=Streptomyces sp. NPDC056796 TaxID=3345947 RepID=UPI0036919DF3